MNRSHHCCACAAVLLIATLTGCHGLSGVRYHDGPMVDDPSCEGCGIADAGMNVDGADVLVGEINANPAVDAPHPRFHPLPTRPVFAPEEMEPVATTTRAAAVSTTGSSVAKPVSSVLAKSSRSAVRLASADVDEVKSNDAQPSSRRKPDVKIESSETAGDEPDAPTPIELDEPQELTPVAESSSDMWRPRVGN